MNLANFSDVLCPDFPFQTGCNGLKTRGTLVRIGVNAGAVYEIVHIEGETAWIREPGTFRGETLVPLDRLRTVQ